MCVGAGGGPEAEHHYRVGGRHWSRGQAHHGGGSEECGGGQAEPGHAYHCAGTRAEGRLAICVRQAAGKIAILLF